MIRHKFYFLDGETENVEDLMSELDLPSPLKKGDTVAIDDILYDVIAVIYTPNYLIVSVGPNIDFNSEIWRRMNELYAEYLQRDAAHISRNSEH